MRKVNVWLTLVMKSGFGISHCYISHHDLNAKLERIEKKLNRVEFEVVRVFEMNVFGKGIFFGHYP